MLALWLELRLGKAGILELYLNRVYFGAGVYGIEAAAQRYFAKSARALTVPEGGDHRRIAQGTLAAVAGRAPGSRRLPRASWCSRPCATPGSSMMRVMLQPSSSP